jgi:predicted DCC family thiol-disulfide oxidoreductase YuxK
MLNDIKPDVAYIIYDGECIFCNQYVRLLKLKQHISVELINARDDDNKIVNYIKQYYDLDTGMIVIYNHEVWRGADAIHKLGLMSTNNDCLNKLHKWVFQSKLRSKMLYPLLKGLRCASLKLGGHSPLSGVN